MLETEAQVHRHMIHVRFFLWLLANLSYGFAYFKLFKYFVCVYYFFC